MTDRFLHIKSAKFPILSGEEEEIVNPGMYGRALAQYLQQQLQKRGYDAPFVCAEDWGWWVALESAPFPFGACIYCRPFEDQPTEYVIAHGAPPGGRKWSWKQLKFLDTTPWIDKLYEDLAAVVEADPEIESLGLVDEMPF